MLVHKFIDGNKPIMVLIHGVLTPWQIWTPQIKEFRKDYNIYVIAMNAHTEEVASEFLSRKSAKLMKKYYPETEVVCFKGDAHCYKVIYQPEKWTEVVTAFLFPISE